MSLNTQAASSAYTFASSALHTCKRGPHEKVGDLMHKCLHVIQLELGDNSSHVPAMTIDGVQQLLVALMCQRPEQVASAFQEGIDDVSVEGQQVLSLSGLSCHVSGRPVAVVPFGQENVALTNQRVEAAFAVRVRRREVQHRLTFLVLRLGLGSVQDQRGYQFWRRITSRNSYKDRRSLSRGRRMDTSHDLK